MNNGGNTIRCRIPQPDIDEALRLYYSVWELGNEDIRRLYPGIGGTRLYKLKALAREEQERQDIVPSNEIRVNIDCAYKAWGIDLIRVDKMYARRLKMARQNELRGEIVGA